MKTAEEFLKEKGLINSGYRCKDNKIYSLSELMEEYASQLAKKPLTFEEFCKKYDFSKNIIESYNYYLEGFEDATNIKNK